MQRNLELLTSDDGEWRARGRQQILSDLDLLQAMVVAGVLGGARMPEDVHPEIGRSSAESYHYFTLTMALNYQRDSYALWRAATATFNDPDTKSVFDPSLVVLMSEDELQHKLIRHKLALQRNRHPQIWRRVSLGIAELFAGDVRDLFRRTEGDVGKILGVIQDEEKARFPYLSGQKICHYWLYVMEQYTDATLTKRHLISVAPDTHVVKASGKIGLVPPSIVGSARAQESVTEAWRKVLSGSGIDPIDIHTRLWLWSRAGFPRVETKR